jgi:hypothetical protein
MALLAFYYSLLFLWEVGANEEQMSRLHFHAWATIIGFGVTLLLFPVVWLLPAGVQRQRRLTTPCPTPKNRRTIIESGGDGASLECADVG